VNRSSLWRRGINTHARPRARSWGWSESEAKVKWTGLAEDERRVGLFEPREVPKVGGLAELVAFHG